MSRRVRLTSWFAHRSQSPEEAAELKRMEADYHAANAAIARARQALRRGDGHSTGADFERAFEEDMRKRAAAASEEE